MTTNTFYAAITLSLFAFTVTVHAAPLDTHDFFKLIQQPAFDNLEINHSKAKFKSCAEFYRLYQQESHIIITNSINNNDFNIVRNELTKCVISQEIHPQSYHATTVAITPQLAPRLPSLLPADLQIPLSNDALKHKYQAVQQRHKLNALENLHYQGVTTNQKTGLKTYQFHSQISDVKSEMKHSFTFMGTAQLKQNAQKVYILHYTAACTQATCRQSEYYLLTKSKNGHFVLQRSYDI